MKFLILCILVVGAFARPHRRPIRTWGNSRIVGGSNASQGEFPYQLSFQEDFLGGYFHFCGASIYNAATSITAAHCVFGEDYANPVGLYVVAGEQNLSIDSGNEQRIIVSRIAIHGSYGTNGEQFDIALLQGQTNFNFNSNVATIPIPAANQETTGNCVVTGWGTLSSGGATPNILQKVTVPVVDDATCQSDYPLQVVTEDMLCAGTAGKDSCQGDSGGPLVCGGELCGVVSWGIGCAEAGHPGVYTQVSYYRSWIINNSW